MFSGDIPPFQANRERGGDENKRQRFIYSEVSLSPWVVNVRGMFRVFLDEVEFARKKCKMCL